MEKIVREEMVQSRGVDFWNGLDDTTVSMDTVAAFKKLGRTSYRVLQVNVNWFEHRLYVF